MIDAPQIMEILPQDTAVIHFTIPRSDIQKVMGPGIGELMATVAAQGIRPAGSIFSHHLRMDAATFDFELGVPVSTLVTPAGRVHPGLLPGGTVARTVYTGPYEGLGGAWGEFEAWLKAHGYRVAPNLWESYVYGPESTANPAQWRTEFTRPLMD